MVRFQGEPGGDFHGLHQFSGTAGWSKLAVMKQKASIQQMPVQLMLRPTKARLRRRTWLVCSVYISRARGAAGSVVRLRPVTWILREGSKGADSGGVGKGVQVKGLTQGRPNVAGRLVVAPVRKTWSAGTR